MDSDRLSRISEYAWRIETHAAMRVPVVIYADAALIAAMDDKVYSQAVNVATLPGVAEQAGLARRVARLRPVICIKG
jgi:tRNA-splicing ligase RtcB